MSDRYVQVVSSKVISSEPECGLGWRGWAEVLIWFALGAATANVMRLALFPALGRSATAALVLLIVLVGYAAGWLRRRQRREAEAADSA